MKPHAKYDPKETPEALLKVMKEGKTIYHFINHFGIVRDTFFKWVETYPEFSDAYEAGEGLAYEWWLELGLMQCDNEAWDNTVWKHTMNTRFRKFTGGVHLRGFNALTKALDQHKYIVRAAADQQILAKEGRYFTDLIESGERIRKGLEDEERLSRIEAQLAQLQK